MANGDAPHAGRLGISVTLQGDAPQARRGPALAHFFRNILRLSVGDFVAKTLTFLAFVWLARVLGVAAFGVLEFANSLLAWFLLLADGGLELWATRETPKTADLPALVARVVPLRFLLASASFVALFLFLPLFPAEGNLRIVIALFGLSLFAQAASLKWLFLGREQMGHIAQVLVAGQLMFALAVIAVIRRPEHVLWVPIVKLAADLAVALGFAHLYRKEFGSLLLRYTFTGARMALGPAIIIGMTQAMGLLNFNFNSIFIGFLLGLKEVGLFNAAYKPVTMLLAAPLTYFTGLFPALARAWHAGPDHLKPIVERSLRLCAMAALPAGTGLTLLCTPIVIFIFGEEYRESAQPLALLAWSAVFVILRGTYRHSLIAAGFQTLDLRAAMISSLVNVSLNVALIPKFGLVGAAGATTAGDVVWFVLSKYNFERLIFRLSIVAAAWKPIVASAMMAVAVYFAPLENWMIRAALGVLVYGAVLAIFGEPWHSIRERRA